MSSQAVAGGRLISYSITSINNANLSFIDKLAWQAPTINLRNETVERIFKSINSNQNKYEKKRVKRDIATKNYASTSTSSTSIANSDSYQSSRQQQGSNQYQLYKPFHSFLQVDSNYDYQDSANQDIYGLIHQRQQQQQQQQPFVYNENLQPHQQPLPNRRFHYSNQQHKNKKPVYAPINQQTVNRILSLLLLFIISICGCIGTIFIISSLTVIESLQTRGNCYLVSLALSHLLVTLIVIPSSALQIMAGDGIDERRLCHYQWLVLEFSFIVSQLSFFLIAADNYLGYKSSEKIITTAELLGAPPNRTSTINQEVQNWLGTSSPPLQAANNPGCQVDTRAFEVDRNNSPRVQNSQFSENTSLPNNLPSRKTSEFSVDCKKQGKVEFGPPNGWLANLSSSLFPFIFKQSNRYYDSSNPQLISSSLVDKGHFDSKQKLGLANQFAEAEVSKQSCFSYKSCCGKLRVVVWILLAWSIAFAYILHQHEVSYGPNFCTASSKYQTINNNNNNNVNSNSNSNNITQKLSQQVATPLVITPLDSRLKTRSINYREDIKTYNIVGSGIDGRSPEGASALEASQQYYLAKKNKSSYGEEGLTFQSNLSSQEVSPFQTQALALASPLQRSATKAVQVGELSTTSSWFAKTKLAPKKWLQIGGEYNNNGSDRGTSKSKEEKLLKRDEKLFVSQNEPFNIATLVPNSGSRGESFGRIRGSHFTSSKKDKLTSEESQMNGRRIDQLKIIKTQLNDGPSSNLKYGERIINQLRRDDNGRQLKMGILRSSNDKGRIYGMDHSNLNTLKGTTQPLKPDLENAKPTISYTDATIRPDNAKFGQFRVPKSNVDSAKSDSMLDSSPLMVVIVQNKLDQADKAAAGSDDYKQQNNLTRIVGFVYNDENNGTKEGKEMVNEKVLRRVNEIRVRETIRRSGCDSCHRNKKGASYVDIFREFLAKGTERQNWLIGNSSWSPQLSSGSASVSSGKQTMSSCNKGRSRKDSSGAKISCRNLSNRYHDDEKNDNNSSGFKRNNNDDCADSDNKLESCLSQSDDKKGGKVGDYFTNEVEAAGSPSKVQKKTLIGSRASENRMSVIATSTAGATAVARSTNSTSIHSTSVTPMPNDEFNYSSTGLLNREPQENEWVLLPEKEEERKEASRIRVEKPMLKYAIGDGEDRQNNQIDANLDAQDGVDEMKEGRDEVKAEDDVEDEDEDEDKEDQAENKWALLSSYEAQDRNEVDEPADNDGRRVILKVSEREEYNNKRNRGENGVKKRKELHRQKLMNNNSGASGMQISAVRFAPDTSGLLEPSRVKERVRRLEQHYSNSDPNSSSNLSLNLNLNPNSQSKSGELIDDAFERQFNKRSLSSMSSSLPGTDVGPPSSSHMKELVLETNNAGSVTSSSPSANKNNGNNINNVVTAIQQSSGFSNNQVSTVSLAYSQLKINNSILNNIPNKTYHENKSELASKENNQRKGPKYHWFMLVGTIFVPNLASAILFARAYLKMKEFKNRAYKPIPLAAAALSANLPAFLMPNSPLPIFPQHQTYTFPLSSKDGVEQEDRTDEVVYNDASCDFDNIKSATMNCRDDNRDYNQISETSMVSSKRKRDSNNENNDNNNEHAAANDHEVEAFEVTNSQSDEDSVRKKQQIKSSTFRDEQEIDYLNDLAGNRQNNQTTTTTTTTRADCVWSKDNNSEEFYQNRRSSSQPIGSTSQQIERHHYQEHQNHHQKVSKNSYSLATSLVEQAEIKECQSHQQVNQVMSAPLGYDQYLFHHFHHSNPANSSSQREWLPQQMQMQMQIQLQSPSEQPSGYSNGQPDPNGLNLEHYLSGQQREVFLINTRRVESGNLNGVTNDHSRGDISFSAPPSATFRQRGVYSSEEVFGSQTGLPNQNHCLSNDRESGQLSGSNDLRQDHGPVYEFRRRRNHAQSFHYGSSSRPSQYSGVLPFNHSPLLENEKPRQELAKLHHSAVLQPVRGGGLIHNVQPVERGSLHQRSPVAKSRQQQQHLLERHRSLPRSSRLHQSESDRPHLATIEADTRITASPSEQQQRLPLRQQLWRQQSEHHSGIQQCQAGVGRGFDSPSTASTSATQPRPGYMTSLKSTIDDSCAQSRSSSQWFQEDEINNKQERQKQRHNKQNSLDTNKQLQLQLQLQLQQHQHQSSKAAQLSRLIMDPTTTNSMAPTAATVDYIKIEADMLAPTTAVATTTNSATVDSTTTNNASNTTKIEPVTSAATSNTAPKQNQRAQLDCRSSKRSTPKQLTQTTEHKTIQERQQQPTSLKPQSLSQIQTHQLVDNNQTSNNGDQNKAILCTYSYMTDDQLLKSNIIVFILNLTLWLPFIVLSIVIQYREHLTQEFSDSVWWMATLNCCSCSYVYALTNKDFREAFNKLFYYCCCKSHVTFQKKTPILRRQLDVDSKGNLRIHIIPGLNVHSNKLVSVSNGLEPVSGSGPGNSNMHASIIPTAHLLDTSLGHHNLTTDIIGQANLSNPAGTVGRAEIGLHHNTNSNYQYNHHHKTIQPNDKQRQQQQQQYGRLNHRSSLFHVSSSTIGAQSSSSPITQPHRSSHRSHTALGTGSECPLSQLIPDAVALSSGHDRQAANYRPFNRTSERNRRYNSSQTASEVL